MLDLQSYEPLPSSAPVRPEEPRNPLLALFLSLVFPGLGHGLLGFWKSAACIAGFEVVFLLLIANGNGMLHGIAIISAPCLYLFAIIDSYFGAREWNAGITGWIIGANPRVTAILNLLTKGFGYFYLGDRTKGIICFFAMMATQSVLLLHTNLWTQVLAISLQAAIALDGYRVARERLFEAHPELRSSAAGEGQVENLIDAANPGQMRPRLVMGFFTVFAATILVSYAILMELNGHTINSNGTLGSGPTGLTYRDQTLGVELTLPNEWTPFHAGDNLASFRTDGASIVVEEQFATYTVDSMLAATEKTIHTRHPAAKFSPLVLIVAGRSASGFDTSFEGSDGTAIEQRVLGLRRNLKLFVLVESWTSPEKRTTLDRIEKTIRLK
jgi:hypothetical protein